MTSDEIRKRFLAFFEKRGHTIIPSASLVPENDPTVLFNTAGMQPLVPYLLGREHPLGKRLANIQKCVRTGDIDEIGDNTHLTFFQMLGNWSLGDYFKKDAITWSYQFLTSKEEGLGLDPQRLYVTVFAGDNNAPRDDEASQIWESVGVPKNRIYFKDASANWWPAVKGKDTWTGPTGPCSEMFYDLTPKGLGDLTPAEYDKADNEQKVVEIWNDVFMEYEKRDGKIVAQLAKKNVDTGAGFERMVAVLKHKDNVYDTDLFEPIMAKIDEFTSKKDTRAQRIIADHIRTSVFLLGDGVLPSNTDQGYILRRLLRRAVRFADVLGMKHGSLFWIAEAVISKYGKDYSNLIEKRDHIKKEIDGEEGKFRKTLEAGLKKLSKLIKERGAAPQYAVKLRPDFGSKSKDYINAISGKDAFDLYQNYGFPFELIREELAQHALFPHEEEFKQEFESHLKHHQVASRIGAEKKFKGGLADHSDKVVQYHTATHLLHKALRDVLGGHVEQKGSNITGERLRFDFSHPQKMTDEEKKKVESIVNEKIQDKLPVQSAILSRDAAEKSGALHFFGDKYGDEVSVYFIGNSLETAYSKEFCGGPHVTNTGNLKGTFKIQKEEAVSAGVRRIKAVLS